jgi:radical SAM superfamily enzyme YgiQ (UPF0313 family)
VEANEMGKWVGGNASAQVHVVPIGVLYVAATVRDVAGADVRVVESSLDCATDAAFLGLLEEFDPDVVGLRGIIFFLEEMQRLARLTRWHGRAKIVAGGPVVKALRTELFNRIPELDVAVKREGERTFVRWLLGEPATAIDGLLYREGDRIVENRDAAEIEDLDGIPFPAYDLVDLARYERQISYAYNHRRQGVLVTGRGCAYTCTFCFQQWDRLRLRSAANVFDEMAALHDRHGVRDFYVVDDIFNVNVKRAFQLFDRIIASGMQVRLYFANGLRADIMTEALVDRAIRAGAIWFTYAIESASEQIQRFVRKHVNLDKAHRIIAYTQRQSVVVNISTMYGFPTETRAQAQETLDWLGTLPRPSLLPYHFCLRFFPGCEIRTQALAAGWTVDQLDASSECAYHDMPAGTPTLSRAEMTAIALEYHQRFGLNNASAVRQAVQTLRGVGYTDDEILDMYAVLTRKPIAALSGFLCLA